jgi:transketolase
VPGHDIKKLAAAFNKAPFKKGRPSVIIADTIKGKGVSFM